MSSLGRGTFLADLLSHVAVQPTSLAKDEARRMAANFFAMPDALGPTDLIWR